MKHNLKITSILLIMFLATQFIGLVILNAGLLETPVGNNKTIGDFMGLPRPETQKNYNSALSQLVIAFVVAIILLFLLMKFKIEIFLRIWFFAVVAIALFLSFLAILKIIPWFVISVKTALIIAAIPAVLLAFIKIFRRTLLIHNFTELLIYPGIAIVFVPLLNIYTIIALLILISIYDMWAVWKSGVMQKMAKYQIKTLKIFSGFFVPYLNKRQKLRLQRLKNSKSLREKGMKVNVAILGGGDIIFPIITAGVMLKTFGLLSAIFVILGATFGLGYLFFLAKKKKFYPAMPFITAGIFIAMLLNWLIL